MKVGVLFQLFIRFVTSVSLLEIEWPFRIVTPHADSQTSIICTTVVYAKHQAI
jgi:hypothetical protein